MLYKMKDVSTSTLMFPVWILMGVVIYAAYGYGNNRLAEQKKQALAEKAAKKLFEEYTDEETGKARELLGFGKGQKMPRFILYPPLGTDDADKIQEESGLTVDKNNFARPTGKTGVAFGLLRCRDGSAIRVIDVSPEGKDKKQVPFQFYVGRARMGK